MNAFSGELEGATVDPVEAFLPCPIGFLLGVDDEECAAAQYAKANSIPYQIVTDIEMFLIADSSDEKAEINDLNKGDFF